MKKSVSFPESAKGSCMLTLPFDIDVAHVLSCDAFLVQDNVLGIPDDHTQVKSEKSTFYRCFFPSGPAPRPPFNIAGSQDYLPLGFPWCDVERRAWWPQVLGENIHPHLEFSLSHSEMKREIKL